MGALPGAESRGIQKDSDQSPKPPTLSKEPQPTSAKPRLCSKSLMWLYRDTFLGRGVQLPQYLVKLKDSAEGGQRGWAGSWAPTSAQLRPDMTEDSRNFPATQSMTDSCRRPYKSERAGARPEQKQEQRGLGLKATVTRVC